MAKFNTFKFNTRKFNAAGGESFFTELEKALDTKPRVKIEFIDVTGAATDISEYYDSGGEVERIKERSPDEIQAGDFDVVFSNHDDFFSEYKTGTFFNLLTQYHGAKIRVWAGFELSDGRVEYQIQQVGFIDELIAHENESKVTIRCRDMIRFILDQKLHNRPVSETPVPGASNVGTGVCSVVNTKPFKTKNETWTLTCTTPGIDGVAIFSVVGSVTGSKGNATSGTEFSTGNGTGGIKFTLQNGNTDWAVNDSFTFVTAQYPEWVGVNPGKIIWSVLTGHNYDSGAAEPWAGFVFALDPTKASTNADIDYDTFVDVIAQFNTADYLTGYAGYSEEATEFLQTILLIFLGSLYTGGDGRIRLQNYQPIFSDGARSYSDDKKIMTLGYNRAVSEILNYVVVHFKATNLWEFDDETINFDGIYTAKDSDSIARYNATYQFEQELKWFTTSGTHAVDFANRLIVKYATPPLVVAFDTGSDGLIAQIGDKIKVTDDKYGFNELVCEISGIVKKFDSAPITIAITARRDASLALNYAYLGSRIDEGDGLSPQASTFGSATVSDKQFSYLNSEYRMY